MVFHKALDVVQVSLVILSFLLTKTTNSYFKKKWFGLIKAWTVCSPVKSGLVLGSKGVGHTSGPPLWFQFGAFYLTKIRRILSTNHVKTC